MINKTVIIFGVFDGIHEGHISLMNQAKKYGDTLVAIVARDVVVSNTKNKLPKFNEVERINNLLENPLIDRVLLGDEVNGSYLVLKEINPDIIFLGYDQQDLYKDIEKCIKNGILPEIKLVYGEPYKPEIFHSSLLNNK